jgi:hypothetical protein
MMWSSETWAELLEPLHRQNNSLPGEVLLELAAHAIGEAGATREHRSSSRASESATFLRLATIRHDAPEWGLSAMKRGGVLADG